MEVDSFKYVSRLVTRYYKLTQVQAELPIPWKPLKKPLNQSRFGLVTSGGLYHLGHDRPFDLEGEQEDPTWGDPSFRVLPVLIEQEEVGASHWHINTAPVREDINILLPVHRFQELAEEGRIKDLAPHAYSFMGYQGFPANQTEWKESYGPQVAEKLLSEEVDNVLLTAA